MASQEIYLIVPFARGHQRLEVRDVPNGTSPHHLMDFYYVYVLRSLNKDFLYVGMTVDLKRRLKEHNNKEELSTKHYAPFELIFYEAYSSRKDAKRREKYLKTTKGKTTLRTMLTETLKSKQ